MSKTGILTEEQVTDEYIMNEVWGDKLTEHIFNTYDEDERKRLFENKRSEIITRSMKPQRLIDLEGWEDSIDNLQLIDARVSKKLESMYPEFILRDMYDNGDLKGKDKSYYVWACEKYLNRPQKELCKLATISTRQYRDHRYNHADDYQIRLCEELFYKEISEDIDNKSSHNITSFKVFMDNLRTLGIPGVDEWGDYTPIDNTIDTIFDTLRAYSGDYIKNVDDFGSLKLFEWYVGLSREERISYGLKP